MQVSLDMLAPISKLTSKEESSLIAKGANHASLLKKFNKKRRKLGDMEITMEDIEYFLAHREAIGSKEERTRKSIRNKKEKAAQRKIQTRKFNRDRNRAKDEKRRDDMLRKKASRVRLKGEKKSKNRKTIAGMHPRKLKKKLKKIESEQAKETKIAEYELVETRRQNFLERKARKKLMRKQRKLEKAKNMTVKTESGLMSSPQDFGSHYDFESYDEYKAPPESCSPDYVARFMQEHEFDKLLGFLNPMGTVASVAASTVTFLFQLYRSRNVLDSMAASHSYVSIICLHGEKIQAWTIVNNFLNTLAYKYNVYCRTEALMDDSKQTIEQMWKSFASAMLETPFLSIFRDTVLSLMSLKFFGKDISKKLKFVFGSAPKMNAIEAITVIIENLTTMIKLGSALASGIPFSEAMLDSNPAEAIITTVKNVLSYSDYLTVGRIKPGYMDTYDYRNQLEDAIKTIDHLLGDMTAFSSYHAPLSNIKLKAERAVVEATRLLSGRIRPTPFAIIIHGKPGAGKSRQISYNAYLWARVKGREFAPNHIYPRIANSDYWSQYDGHWCVHYSELANQSKAMSQKQIDAHVAELCSVVDSLPFSLNMDGVEDKGKTYISAELVLADTNNPGMHLDYQVCNKAAVERRFVYVEVVPKEKYRQDNGCGIDPQKANDPDVKYMDKWLFTVTIKTPLSNTLSDTNTLLKDGDIFQYTELMTTLMQEHMEREGEYADFVNHNNQYYDEVFDDMKVEAESGWINKFEFDTVKNVCTDFFTIGRTTSEWTWYFFLVIIAGAITDCSKYKNIDRTFTFDKIRATLLVFLYVFYYYVSPSIGLILPLVVFFDLRVVWNMILTHCNDIYAFRQQKRAAAEKLKNQLGWMNNHNPFVSISALKYVTAIVSVYGVYKIFSKVITWFGPQVYHPTESSGFLNKSEIASILKQKEDSFDSGNSYVRYHNKVDVNCWNVSEKITPLSTHKGNTDTLTKQISSCIRRSYVELHNGKKMETYILGISGNVGILNAHALGPDYLGVKVHLCLKGYVVHPISKDQPKPDFHTITITEHNVHFAGDDLAFILCPDRSFRDITKYFINDHKVFGTLAKHPQGRIADDNVVAMYVEKPLKMEDAHFGVITLPRHWVYAWVAHAPGKCGIPLLVNSPSGAFIAGIHSAGEANGARSFASSVTRDVILEGVSKLHEKSVYFTVRPECMVFETLPPTVKSLVHYEDLSRTRHIGKLPGHVLANNSSKLTKTRIHHDVCDIFKKCMQVEITEKYGPPLMKARMYKGEYVSPWNVGIRKMNKDVKQLDDNVMIKVIDAISSHIHEFLDEEKDRDIRPLTIEAAINGVLEDPFLRRMNANTAAGYGHAGKKKGDLFPIISEEDDKLLREPTEEFMHEINDALDKMMDGYMLHPVIQSKLKDEPRSIEKIAAGKTRIFYVSPTVSIVISRMFLAPFYTLMVEKGDVFGTSVGVNMHTGVDTFMSKFVRLDGTDNIIEGDYGGYDVSMPLDVSRACYTIIINVLERYYNDTAMNVVHALMSDNLYPVIEMLLDLYLVPGLQPSGKYATAEDNSLKGLIMLMYHWYSNVHTREDNFFDHIIVRTYGDDVLANVSMAKRDDFNALTYAKCVKDDLGMDFTTASKEDIVDPFVSVEDMTFLKRKFRYREDLGHWTAQLDVNSIAKSLMWRLPSTVIYEEDQMIQTLASALWELFFHLDEETHTEIRGRFIDTIMDHYPEMTMKALSSLPTFDSIRAHLGYE